MSKDRIAKGAAAPSAYISLREAVRPAIFAHSLLAGQQNRAGLLAEECEALLEATRELLRTIGLVRILTPDREMRAYDFELGESDARVSDAYANAGMLWAEVVGKSLALAESLIGEGRSQEMLRLADFLEDAGELKAAASLRSLYESSKWAAFESRLSGTSNHMSEKEIRKTIEILREALRDVSNDFPRRDVEISRFLAPLAISMRKVLQKKNEYWEGTYGSIELLAGGSGSANPRLAGQNLDQVAAEFESELADIDEY